MDGSLFYGSQRVCRVGTDQVPEPVLLRVERFIIGTSNEDGSKRYTTKSLFDITLLFVAEHLHRVDSLLGFPEAIGAKLFSVAFKIKTFSIQDLAPKALQLFDEAYGETVLKSACLRNRAHLLDRRGAEVKSFLSLTSLDLFGCHLGDEHWIFQHLTSPSLARLVHLFLGRNAISDAGMQRLTAPVRIMHRGLACLQHLDLSCNPISKNGLRYLTCLPKLIAIDVSDTKMKLSTGLKKTVWELLGLSHSEKPLNAFDHSRCKTEGWAEPVVHQWETQDQRNNPRPAVLCNVGRLQTGAGEHAAARTQEPVNFLQFHKTANCVTNIHSAPSLRGTDSFDKKRKREAEDCERGLPKPQPAQLGSPFTEQDMDLLNSY